MKTCARCKESKPSKEFYVNRCWADGRHPYCKQCLLAYQAERRRSRLDREDPARRRWSRTFVRHDYFARIDRPQQAYVAGLLAADGNVLERQKRISLELSIRDLELVEQVRDEFAPGFPVRRRVRRTGRTSAVLAITSAELCADLAALGISPRKSLILRWPQHLKGDLARAFLLGYFDGDGFVTWSRTGRHAYPRWGLYGTKSFLTSAMQLVSDELGISPRRVRPKPATRICVLAISGADAFAVDRWLHSDDGLGLDRKRPSLEGPTNQADSPASSPSGT